MEKKPATSYQEVLMPTLTSKDAALICTHRHTDTLNHALLQTQLNNKIKI